MFFTHAATRHVIDIVTTTDLGNIATMRTLVCFAICGIVGAFHQASQAHLSTRMKQRLPRQPGALKMGLETSKAERTFIMVKPDGVVRGLCGRIIQRFEDKGLKLVATKFTKADPDTLNTHYSHIADKPFYPEVFDYMTSAPVFQLVFEGPNAVVAGRTLLGATDPMQAPLG
jgi:nucleoside-diphosphate kinase